jgi:ribosome maturation factor RimP
VAAVIDLEKLLDPTISGLGYQLVEVQRQNRGRLVRVFIDKDDGVDVEDCALVNRHLLKLFLVEKIEYDRVDVSSPGLDRLLRKKEDFVRFAGRQIKVKMKEPVDGQRNFTGILMNMQDGKMELKLEEGMMSLDIDNLVQARLVPNIDWRRK